MPREILTRVERDIMLQIVDQQWKDHLYSLDHLKEGIGLRGYGQRDPLVEYKKESFALFQDMRAASRKKSSATCGGCKPVVEREGGEPHRGAGAAGAERPAAAQLQQPGSRVGLRVLRAAAARRRGRRRPRQEPRARPASGGDDAPIKTVKRDEPKIGRNDPCWCGSGKKFKKCHGA